VPEEINQPYGKMKIPHLEVFPNPEASFDEPIAKRTGEKEIGILPIEKGEGFDQSYKISSHPGGTTKERSYIDRYSHPESFLLAEILTLSL